MKKMFIGIIGIVSILASTLCFGAEVSVLAISDGGIRSTASYYSFSGSNPFVETRFQSKYFSIGSSGLGITNSFSGDGIKTQDQFEVQTGVGNFVSKAGPSILANSSDEETGVVTGVLNQSAIGFGGEMTKGLVTTAFDTTAPGGFTGIGEGQGTGTFKAGAVQVITVGTSEQSTLPKTVSFYEAHWTFGPGQYQAKVEIVFPK